MSEVAVVEDDYLFADRVIGELSEPHEYIRQRRPVVLEDHRIVQAWLYLYNRETDERSSIPSGDYCAFLTASGES